MYKLIRDNDDIIIIKKNNVFSYIFLLSWAVLFIILNLNADNIFLYIMAGAFFLFGLYLLVYSIIFNESITVDNKYQTIIYRKESHFFNYLKTWKIPFLDINSIEIHRLDLGDAYGWGIYIRPFKGASKKIFYAQSKSDAEIIAKKIGKITDKIIIDCDD